MFDISKFPHFINAEDSHMFLVEIINCCKNVFLKKTFADNLALDVLLNQLTTGTCIVKKHLGSVFTIKF